MRFQIIACSALLGLLACDTAAAKTFKMVCENWRREYVVTFDGEYLDAEGTDYKVLAVENTKQKLVVAGLTTPGGPTVRAHFRPYQKLEFYTDGDLSQTDGCRSVTR